MATLTEHQTGHLTSLANLKNFKNRSPTFELERELDSEVQRGVFNGEDKSPEPGRFICH